MAADPTTTREALDKATITAHESAMARLREQVQAKLVEEQVLGDAYFADGDEEGAKRCDVRVAVYTTVLALLDAEVPRG